MAISKIGNKALGAGTVLQVVQVTKTDSFSTAGTTFTQVTGLTCSITPSSTSSKILCFFDLNISEGVFNAIYRYMRDSTPIYTASTVAGKVTASGMSAASDASYVVYNMNRVTGVYLDNPSTTSAVTYSVQIAGHNGAATAYVNRTSSDRSTENYDVRGASSITLMEIAA